MIALDFESNTPLYVQIYEALRQDIKSGALASGKKLTPIRRLAADLNVSRNTIEAAYAQLLAEGYVRSRSGSGYIVEDLDFSSIAPSGKNMTEMHDFIATIHSGATRFDDEPFNATSPFEFDFTYGNRPKNSFPASIWKNLVNEALFDCESRSFRYSDGLGEPDLRREIASHLKISRGVNCLPEQVIIQPGTQAALSNLLTLFDSATDAAAMENPGYDGVTSVFENRGFRLIPLPVAHHANDPANERTYFESLNASGAKLAFCTPSNQFPAGRTMPLASRIRMIEWAEKNDGYILEDDYCREFRYGTKPIPSLQSLDTRNRVVYMGTFSKILSPALRMSYLILPPRLLVRWRRMYRNYYCSVPWLSQRVLYLFLKNGHWDRYTRKQMTGYTARRNALMESIEREMGDKVHICGGDAGLHILIGTKDGRSQEELIEAAKRRGVRVYETRRYWIGGADAAHGNELENHVLVGFSSIETNRIAPGIKRLREAWFGDE